MVGTKSRIVRTVAGFPLHHKKPNSYSKMSNKELDLAMLETARKYGIAGINTMEPDRRAVYMRIVKKYDPGMLYGPKEGNSLLFYFAMGVGKLFHRIG